MSKNDWFVSWFDTSYYHLLYRKRNEEEARQFIENLIAFLNLKSNASVLDLCCGKGRHSITLNNLGMNVLGVDLSENSIAFAKQFENEKLHFQQGDMRHYFGEISFDAVFNLFTSFGYFEEEKDNQTVFESVFNMLKANGYFIFDYLNLEPTLSNLVTKESKTIENIDFEIERIYDGTFIRKKITVIDGKNELVFEEKVRGYSKANIENILAKSGLTPLTWFGDFQLNPYNELTSERMILISKKIQNL